MLQAPSSGDTITWNHLHGSAIGLALSQLLSQSQPYLVVAANHLQAQSIQSQIAFFTAGSSNQAMTPVDYFPDWETLPYDLLSPHPDITSKRISLLSRLPQGRAGMTITALPTLLQKLPPPSHFKPIEAELSVGKSYPLPRLRADLEHAGYHLVDRVSEHGQYNVRGSLIDYFASGSEYPLRIELCDDDIESLRYFDPETQVSIQKINATNMPVASEYPQNEAGIEHFRQAWRESFSGTAHKSPIYQNMSERTPVGGIEYYLPLFFDRLYSLFDYIPKKTIIITIGDLSAAIEQHWKLIQHREQQLSGNILRPLCPSRDLFFSNDELLQKINSFGHVTIQAANEKQFSEDTQHKHNHTKNDNQANTINFNSEPAPKLKLNLRSPQPLAPLQDFLNKKPSQVLITCQTAGRLQTMLDLLQTAQIPARPIDHWQLWLELVTENTAHPDPTIHLCTCELIEGLYLPEQALLVLTENELFANFVPQKRRRKAKTFDLGHTLTSLDELTLGAPVVHRQHGVGRYLGLETISTGEHNGEFMVLEYAEQTKVYVPIQSMDLISRYIGTDVDHAPLHHLGRAQWQKAKEKAAARIRDVAAELLITYSRRQAAKGFAFPAPDQHYRSFCAAFPFEETPDQITSIDAIIQDMCDERCMDRLICGDVGFGKTEVAMRAAFLAVMAGKQVAILVPTTLLANQHQRTFIDRFAGWPIKLAGLSRFQTTKQQNHTLVRTRDRKNRYRHRNA